MRLKSFFAVVIIGVSVAGWTDKADATVMTYDMFWTGDGGYSMTGVFSFDDASLAASPLVGYLDLLSFEATAFKPDGSALETYAFSQSDYSVFSAKNFLINFNFESDTGILRQDASGGITSPFNLIFGSFTLPEVQPAGWLLYAGKGTNCGPFFETVLDRTSAGCLTAWDGSKQGLVQVRQRVEFVRVSEPGTFAMLGLGILGLGFAARRARI